MLKHMLTQTPSLPADLAPTAAKNTTNSGAGSNGVPRPQGPPPAPPSAGPAGVSASLGPGPNFKLASRANQQNSNNSGQMLDSQATATTDSTASHLDVSTIQMGENKISLFLLMVSLKGVSSFFASLFFPLGFYTSLLGAA